MRKVAALAAVIAIGVSVSPARAAALAPSERLAGRCVAVTAKDTQRPLGRYYVKATGLGAFMLAGVDGRLLAVDGSLTTQPGPAAEWTVGRATADLRFARAAGCTPFPEADLDATGRPFRGRLPDGSVFGFADAHLHITADLRAGGRVLYGKAFDRFGITEALGHDADDHGPNGVLDVTGNLLRSGLPVGTHDNGGWPTFTGWPTYDTNTHQQIYYRWLQRAWMAGLRLVVAQTVEDEPLCRIEPVKSHSCDETDTILLEVARLRALQDYVDAQSGGRGRGWLRIVENPAAARRAIERGKLAVIIGLESSNPFGCSEVRGIPRCDRAGIDRGIARLRAAGVRGLFIAHWVDNALAGAALEGGDKGVFIGALNLVQTAMFFRTGACPQPGQGEEVVPAAPDALSALVGQLGDASPEPLPVHRAGRQCNTRGLTDLGAYAVRRLMDEHMLIEVDHLSEPAREQVLAMAEARHYPLVSSHTGTGGTWTADELRRLHAIGGYATARVDEPGALADAILKGQHDGGFASVGLGSDVGGFSTLPAPNATAGDPLLAYPFRSFDGRVEFERQETGRRTFDLNTDGMAHYGLLPDLLAQVQARPNGPAALNVLFHSAEAYLRMWARTGI